MNGYNRFIRNFTILASAVLVARHFVQPAKVSGNSMFPELHTDDRLLIDKTAYEHSDPEPGDVVVFTEPRTGKSLIKRVIGVPGDHIVIRNGEVKINGVIGNDDYTADGATDGNVDLVVPEGRYFMLGDNRLHSKDSRAPVVGCVPGNAIIGKVNIRLFPPGRVFSRDVLQPEENESEHVPAADEATGALGEQATAVDAATEASGEQTADDTQADKGAQE